MSNSTATSKKAAARRSHWDVRELVTLAIFCAMGMALSEQSGGNAAITTAVASPAPAKVSPNNTKSRNVSFLLFILSHVLPRA